MSKINVTVWNEGRHEKSNAAVQKLYPKGMHEVIAGALRAQSDMNVRIALLDDGPEHGLTDEVLNSTDVLTWWGHLAHRDVSDAIATKVQQRVLHGMGLIVLHSGHFSKVFTKLMGTGCGLKWREIAEKERIWNLKPSHPITQGIGDYFEIPNVEMYGEPFGIPEPDELIFISWFEGGEVFRSGCCWNRGLGKVFYFRPGHETCPIFYNPDVQKVIVNAVRWARPLCYGDAGLSCPNYKPLENVPHRELDLTHVPHLKGK
ncbi:MAG: ThuA domain-containing protein [Planctomycetaceae bacterium]|nr:ThuA domain-containing protein [Planctomycetaceae bacterium]